MSKPLGHKKPRFSVVIPAYNEADYISATLDSLKSQDFDGTIEIVVVDNSSTDNTAAVARKHGARVVYEKNLGVCWARQCGTEAANGEIIISTDADTTFSNDWISSIDSTFNENKSIIATAGACRYMNGPWWANIFAHSLFGLVRFIYTLTGKTYYASATNIAFYKKSWPGYDTNLTQGGDELDLLRNLRKRGLVQFTNKSTFTSSRRQVRGLFYNLFVTGIMYYVLEYALSRAVGHSVFGSAPKFRNDLSPRQLRFVWFSAVLLTASVLVFYNYHTHSLSNYSLRFLDRFGL